jgi:conjugal transfer pilus assembly protein TraF
MGKKGFIQVLWITSLISSTLEGASFFEDHARGWHWYEPLEASSLETTPPEVPSQKAEDQRAEISRGERPQGLSPDPSLLLEAYQEQVKQQFAAALMNPTPQTLYAYMALQKQVLERAHHFAQLWQQVVLHHPELDDTVKFPTTQVGRQVFYGQEKKEIFQTIQSLKDSHGLYFFFSNSCPYSKAFGPIVKTFASKHGWKVLAISLGNVDPLGPLEGGGAFQEFKDAVRDNGIAAKLGVTHVPALFVVDPGQGRVLPIAHGLISEAEIEQRILSLTKGGEGS